MKKVINKIFSAKNEQPPHKTLQIGKYVLRTERSHPLDVYRKEHPLYDAFLPHICSKLDGLVIDIGANVGDTALAIFAQNDSSFITGVEPDADFYAACIENINANGLQQRFLLVDKFISSEKATFQIDKNLSASTGSMSKHFDENSNSLTFKQLMALIPKDKKSNFGLVKIDTDGFDWDILNSYNEMAYEDSSSKARFLFFEFQSFLNNIGYQDPDRPMRNEKYRDALLGLQQNGYSQFCVFDNFGTHLTVTDSVDEIVNLSEYISRSQVYNKTSTFFHLDVLAFATQDLTYVKQELAVFYEKNKQ